jgi:ABC-type transport system substrate-binding protein
MGASTAPRKLTLVVCLAALTFMSIFPATVSSSSLEAVGPSLDELVYTIVPEFRPDVERALLKARQIDIIPRVQGLPALLNMSADPEIELHVSPRGSTRMAFLVFNTRRSPFDDVEFRRAISCLVDRGFIANKVFGAWAEPLNTFIPQASLGWVNPNALACEYDVGNAMEILRDAGYRFDIRTRKMTDPGTGRPLREMTLLTPQLEEAICLWIAGNTTSSYASILGIPIRHVALPESELKKRAIEERDFDLLVYDHDVGAPPFELYNLLHSSLDRQSTNAYSGIHDPELDRALEGLWFGTGRTEAVKSAHDAQTRLAALVPYVPIYSISNVAAASPQWEGLANMIGIGVVNPWTYIGVHKVGEPFGGRFTQSIAGELKNLNPVLANEHEWEVLNRLYTPLLAANPETPEDMPMLAEGWETEKWTTSTGKPGMRITFRLVDGVMWHDGDPFTAQDVKFCIEFLAANKIPQFQDIWGNLAKVETPDKATVQIYLNETGYRYLYELAGMTFLPEHIWKDVKDYKNFRPWEEPHQTVKGLTKLIGQGPFIFKEADLRKYVRLVWNPLYFMKNPEKPSLLERLTETQTTSAGNTLNVRYGVVNHTRHPITDPDVSFKLQVKRSDGAILLSLPARYADGAYEAEVDTGKIGAGDYVCEFNASPYGLDTFTLTVEESPAILQQPVWILIPVVMVAALVITTIVILRRKSTHPKTCSVIEPTSSKNAMP